MTYLRAKDYEQGHGNGVVTIFEGHPCYCAEKRRHKPHRFVYRYLRFNDEVTDGHYWCDGEPTSFAVRPVAESRDDDMRGGAGPANALLGPLSAGEPN